MAVDGTVISFPKSGRTWLRYVLMLAGAQARFTHVGADTGGHYAGHSWKRLRFDVKRFAGGKVVLLHRNPLDTVVSNYMQMHRRELPARSLWQSFVMRINGRYPPRAIADFVLSPRYGVEKICRFNLGWASQLAGRPDTIAVRYEQLKADSPGEIARLLEFLRPDLLTHVDVTEIARASSFDEMKKLETAGAEVKLAIGPLDPNDPESFKIRRGEVGGYTRYLDPDTIRAAEAIMDRLSYERGMAATHGS